MGEPFDHLDPLRSLDGRRVDVVGLVGDTSPEIAVTAALAEHVARLLVEALDLLRDLRDRGALLGLDQCGLDRLDGQIGDAAGGLAMVALSARLDPGRLTREPRP